MASKSNQHDWHDIDMADSETSAIRLKATGEHRVGDVKARFPQSLSAAMGI
jgi:hypothetical protein